MMVFLFHEIIERKGTKTTRIRRVYSISLLYGIRKPKIDKTAEPIHILKKCLSILFEPTYMQFVAYHKLSWQP